jgi:hypothetical protein
MTSGSHKSATAVAATRARRVGAGPKTEQGRKRSRLRADVARVRASWRGCWAGWLVRCAELLLRAAGLERGGRAEMKKGKGIGNGKGLGI